MSFVSGTFSVVCNQCGVQTDFNSDEADFESTGGSERQMGPENGYSWESSFNCDCGNEIEFDYNVHEYPQGAFNHEDVRITGATVNDMFTYDFNDEPEQEDFE
ncbi:hypothetical protein FNO01nite_29450 [Flavobacterium noncentrifugens]|uniref:Uncharacterized protein n=1 Tax=Flavobacterium noncentrifugens TaxID=1128970 RepID=A0A1G8Y1E8_9FLAO|nr:hypothetical protein [Flavobacterium noncentrifugens]GEP52273.1 hypothetical protein FNO01nite_29450 [Flavobacterium noncentrifugens]SDJ96611.1 hypothetical protein SAMN04487935_2152 [Flavobacterium noncentrifugens]